LLGGTSRRSGERETADQQDRKRVKLGALKRFRSIVGPNETGARFEALLYSNRSGECAPRPFKPVVIGLNARADHQADHQATEVTRGYFDHARKRPWNGHFQRPVGAVAGLMRDSTPSEALRSLFAALQPPFRLGRSRAVPLCRGGRKRAGNPALAGRTGSSKDAGLFRMVQGGTERGRPLACNAPCRSARRGRIGESMT